MSSIGGSTNGRQSFYHHIERSLRCFSQFRCGAKSVRRIRVAANCVVEAYCHLQPNSRKTADDIGPLFPAYTEFVSRFRHNESQLFWTIVTQRKSTASWIFRRQYSANLLTGDHRSNPRLERRSCRNRRQFANSRLLECSVSVNLSLLGLGDLANNPD